MTKLTHAVSETGMHVSPFRKLQEIRPMDSRWTGGFWNTRARVCLEKTIPSLRESLNDLQNGAVFENFVTVAEGKSNSFYGTFWSDGDCYKYLEAVTYLFGLTKDKSLLVELEERIAQIAAAQEEDGYLNTQIQILGEERWCYRKHHEDYNLGHLFTAAAVHRQITGKANFLEIAERAADCLKNRFIDDREGAAIFGWNPSHIMGLVDLYRVTAKREYLELGNLFLESRGTVATPSCRESERLPDSDDQNQMGRPIKEEDMAVGHAVTASYLYAGGADVYSETGDEGLLAALERLWTDYATSKVYVTGGIGSHHNNVSVRGDWVHEAFGMEYRLPNKTAYNETCANIGNAMFSHRMMLITGESKYGDMAESVLYNSGLSGNSIDGERFCYTNPLRWNGPGHQLFMHDSHERWKTWNCFCCPPQVGRMVAKIHSWAYCLSDDGIVVNLYGSSELETKLNNGESVKLVQTSQYPWSGDVEIRIEQPPESEMVIRLRIPNWAEGTVALINDEPHSQSIPAGSFLEVARKWKSGDRVRMTIPMRPRLICSNSQVEETRNQVAIAYGPVVYCLESTDLPDGVSLSQIHIPRSFNPTPRYDDGLLGGMVVVEGKAVVRPMVDDALYKEYKHKRRKSLKIMLIPYYAWNNRGEPEMSVWLPLG